MKRLIIAISAVLITFIATTYAVSVIILKGDQILTSFSIINVENISTNFTINHQTVRAATSFEIVVYDEQNLSIFSKNTESTTNHISLPMLQYDTEYTIMIYAFDSVGDRMVVNNPYTFRYTEPTFSSENSLILTDNEDYELIIKGDLARKGYQIRVTLDDKILKEATLTSNEFMIESELFNEIEGVFDVEIFDNTTQLHKISLYNNISPIADIKITAPEESSTINFNDVIFSFEGGERATQYLVQIYQGRNLIKETTIKQNRAIISHEIFSRDQEYKIILTASYKDYEEYNKTSEVTFKMNERFTLRPAYINVNHRYVAEGSQIVLNHPNRNGGSIYYTLDGSDPTTNGIKYTEPITVTENIHLKTVVMEPLYNNSIIGDFPINVGVKPVYTVYLSPSNQRLNLGVRSTGYTNEMAEMNTLTNYIEARLLEYKVRVFRNSPNGTVNGYIAESRFRGADLHLAIHSNGSPTATQFGIETWIHEEGSRTYSLANQIQNALMDIYWSDEPKANRGVRFANGAIGEANDNFLPFGILLEVAFHDQEQDAAWIMQNTELIGNTIADAVLRYFGII